jgi:hypothetical protein
MDASGPSPEYQSAWSELIQGELADTFETVETVEDTYCYIPEDRVLLDALRTIDFTNLEQSYYDTAFAEIAEDLATTPEACIIEPLHATAPIDCGAPLSEGEQNVWEDTIAGFNALLLAKGIYPSYDMQHSGGGNVEVNPILAEMASMDYE